MSEVPLLSVDDLITESTPDEVEANLYNFAGDLGLITKAWQKLSPLRTFFKIVAKLFAGFTSTQAQVNAAAFLDTATKGWLTLLAWFVYGVLREAATYATGVVTVTNAAGGVYNFGPGDLVFLNSTTGKTYANVDAITINSGPGFTLDVNVQATEAGAASTATPGQIDAFVASSPQLSCTNATLLLGVDEELDADLRTRCRAKLGSLSPNGPAKAFEYVATTRALNGDVDVTRVRVLPAIGDGTIRVVVASSAGEVLGTTGDPTSPLGKVFVALSQLALPTGYTLILTSATPVVITPDAAVYISTSSGLSSPDAITKTLAALTSYVPTIPIGGTKIGGANGYVLFRALEGVMRAADSGIIEAKLTVEADTLLGDTDVAVLGVPDITPVQVSP